MKKSHKDLTGYNDKKELESNITVIYSKVISGKLARQMNPEKYKNQIRLEVLLVATKDNKIFIYDLETREVIYELDLNLTNTNISQNIAGEQITAVTIIEKEDAPVLMIYTKDYERLIQHNITTQETSSELIKFLRNSIAKLATGFPKEFEYYADAHIKDTIKHNTYSLQLNISELYMDITYNNIKKQISFPDNIRLALVNASHQKNSPFVAIRDRFPFEPTDTIYIYDVHRKKRVRKFEKYKKDWHGRYAILEKNMTL